MTAYQRLEERISGLVEAGQRQVPGIRELYFKEVARLRDILGNMTIEEAEAV